MSFENEQFQSTRPPARTRRAGSGIDISPERFNPRVLAGGRDCPGLQYSGGCDVSIHASSREDATHGTCRIWSSGGFQSTRPRGRTRRVIIIRVPAGFWFQSTRPRGRTRPPRRRARNRPSVSIHASSREDATRLSHRLHFPPCFNPRVLAGGRD